MERGREDGREERKREARMEKGKGEEVGSSKGEGEGSRGKKKNKGGKEEKVVCDACLDTRMHIHTHRPGILWTVIAIINRSILLQLAASAVSLLVLFPRG